MRKLVIIGIILILSILAFFVIIQGISLSSFKINSIKQLQSSSNNLDDSLSKASELTKKIYPEAVDSLEKSVKGFNTVKSEYDSKLKYTNETEVATVKETYDIEFLWTILGNYATKEGVILTLDIKEGVVKDNYNLSFTLVGSYVGITDFIYDIENDERLNFQAENLVMEVVILNDNTNTNTNTNTNSTKSDVTNNIINPTNITNTTNTAVNNTTKNNTTTTNTTKNQEKGLQAKFDVSNIAINLN